MDWTEKYRPESVDDIVGNEEQVERIESWLASSDRESPLVLYGPPGVGKTSIVLALARDAGYEIHELNASSDRTGEVLEERFIEVGQSRSYHGRPRLILLDEADALDRGGVRAVNKGIRQATEPIIIVANDFYDGIPKSIRDTAETVEFEPVDPDAMLSRLEEICEAEGVDCSMGALTAIAEKSEGDMRAAIRDLESAIMGTSGEITLDSVHEAFGNERRIVYVGPDDVDPTAVWQALDMWFSGSSDGRWVIPLSPGFELVVAEYAAQYGIRYDVHLPCHYPDVVSAMGWTDDDRLESVIETADRVIPIYEPEQMDAFDYEEYWEMVYCDIDAVYGWIEDDMADRVRIGWAYPGGGIERVNFATI